MAVTTLNSGKVVFSNATQILFTPYTNVDTIGSTSYDLVDILADSLSFTPDDNTINSKDAEFRDEPLFENIMLGKIQFAATSTDMQNTIMKELFGWSIDATSSAAFAPNAYQELWCKIEVVFGDSTPRVVAPKVKMNSKAVISTLKTGSAEGQIAGTCYAQDVKVGTVTKNSPLCFIPVGTTYMVGSEIV